MRELEKRGIGRPSTYAEIISKVQQRATTSRSSVGRRFQPTLLGKFVVDGLVESNLDFMDPDFTAQMEEELDEVGAGTLERVALLKRFYKRFREQLDKSKKHEALEARAARDRHRSASECGSKMLKRGARTAGSSAARATPKCKGTQDLGPDGDGTTPRPVRDDRHMCDKCGKPMVIKTGRYGEFLSCTGYPECKNARPVPLGVPCPKCGGDIIEIKSRKARRAHLLRLLELLGRHKCDFKLWQKPVPEPCP